MQIKVSDGQFFVNGYPVQAGFTLSEGEMRRVSYIAKRGAGCVTLRLSEGSLRIEGEIGRIDWKEGIELCPLEDAPLSVIPCEVQGESILVRIGREIDAGAFHHEALFPVHAPSVRYLSRQRIPLLQITGRTTAGDYLAVLSLRKGEERILLEAVGHIRAAANEVSVTRDANDLRARRITDVYTWQGDYFEHTSHSVESTYTAPFPREKRGRLLIEAVSAEDEAEIRALTTAELVDMRALSEYFGEIERVRDPIFPASPTAAAVQKKTPNGRVAVTYDFSFEGDRIENILCADE